MFESSVALFVFVAVVVYAGWKLSRPFPDVFDLALDQAAQAKDPQEALAHMVQAVVALVPPGRVVALAALARVVEAEPVTVAKTLGRLAEAGQGQGAKSPPWWRVVRKKGLMGQLLTLGETLAETQKKRLLNEGVAFLAEDAVNLPRHEWHPPQRHA